MKDIYLEACLHKEALSHLNTIMKQQVRWDDADRDLAASIGQDIIVFTTVSAKGFITNMKLQVKTVDS